MVDNTAAPQSYDLALTTGRSLFWLTPHRGVTLSDDAIAWTSDGKPERRPLADIAGVHVECAWVARQGMTDLCAIQFSDGIKLTASNLRWGTRAADSGQTELLRAFADDLHRRLARAGKPGIGNDAGSAAPSATFTAGFSPVRYWLLVGTAATFSLIALTASVVGFIVTGKAQVLFPLLPLTLLLWPVVKTAGKNAPRRYEPGNPPDELMQ